MLRPSIALVLLGLAGPALAGPPAEAVALQKAVHQLIDAAEPSVACLLVSRSEKYADLAPAVGTDVPGRLGGFNMQQSTRFMDGPRRELLKRLDLANPDTVPEAYGSGVVLDETGLILTTYHVVAKATKVYVRLPGNRGSYADIVAADGRADLAVLKMIVPPPGLKPVKFGDGAKARKGDWVIALANPFAAGFKDGGPSASFGLVSNVRRRAPGPTDEATRRNRPLAQHNSLLQTDVRLALGSSGGALFNLNGEMIGLTTALAAVTGGEVAGGYAVPLDANTKKMIEVLKRGEEIEYGFLGVTVDPEDRAGGRGGVVVRSVAPGLPAARAGLLPGDVITSIQGNPVREQDDLFLHISAALAGTEAKIEVLRASQPRAFDVRLAKASRTQDDFIASNRPKPVFGLRVDYASTLALDANAPDGVLVKELEPGSPADKHLELKEWTGRAQLIVTAINGKPVATPAEFYKEAAGKPKVRLTIVEAVRRADSHQKDITLP